MRKRNLFFSLLFIALLFLVTQFGAKATTATPVFTYAKEEKRIYLTFDDGPSTVVTNQVLDVLKAENVKATFFIVSDRAQTRKTTLKRIVSEGHSVGVHSKTHDYEHIYSSKQALLDDIRACADFIRAVTGVSPTLYRFPGGEKNKDFRILVEREGFRVVGWNACCRDEEILNAPASRLVDESVKSANNKKSVTLLLHDSAHHGETVKALPLIIAHFREQGYVFCAY